MMNSGQKHGQGMCEYALRLALISLIVVDAWNIHWNSRFRRRISSPIRLLLAANTAADNDIVDSLDPLKKSMMSMGFSNATITSIQQQLQEIGIPDSSQLALLAADFVDRPEIFAREVLQTDFGFPPLLAHQTRAAVMNMISAADKLDHNIGEGRQDSRNDLGSENQLNVTTLTTPEKGNSTRPYKSVVVNDKARQRRQRAKEKGYDYGLPSDYRRIYPTLALELDDFYIFMTRPSTLSQDEPIRPATADVYMRHAKLFLGWYLSQSGLVNGERVKASLFTLVPDKEKQSAEQFLEFVLWLRSERRISVSYEANVLRGLTKLLKFRFSRESQADPSYGEKSFEDIPLIRELRKMHRDANKRQSLAPRSSDEERKWLTWSEYLSVIEQLKKDLFALVQQYEANLPDLLTTKAGRTQADAKERVIATTYQQYLILSIFACVPDRQRTIRELEIGRSMVKDEKILAWTIKHGPDDYKTGKTYGDRPALALTSELSPHIDDFLAHWRPSLNPTTDYMFVQPRTGNPLTRDSVYQIVSRSCYKYSGKRTNPHLLRDMIVTHVRESDASEKQLEALALFMGHSIQMQRTSYDRRTLTKKVAPAVELLQSVNRRELSHDKSP